MAASAPVCHVPPSTPAITPQPGPANIASVPPAGPSIASLVATVNALRQVVQQITGQSGVINNFTTQPSKSKPARWVEDARVVETERVFQNGDKTSQNWVDVERINSLTMKDGVTGETWRWDRNRS